MELTEKEDKQERYIIFKLDNEDYAIDVYRLKEVITNTQVTEVPNASPFVKGVISLRGSVIPVLDIKRCLGLSDNQPTRKARIVVVSCKEHIAGLSVDSIEGVKNITSDIIMPVPQFSEGEKTEFLEGIIEHNNRFIMVLKISDLLERLRYEN